MAADHPIVHQQAAVLSIGDELTLGETVDTNSAWISRRLAERAVMVRTHVTVADSLDAIAETFQELSERVDLVISTGGLGPTDDDLTRPALAKALGDVLIEDEGAVAWLQERFERVGRPLLEANRVQAQRPMSAACLHNDRGTAPGLAARRVGPMRSCDFFCLPGPPREMQPMFEKFVAPRLNPPSGHVIRVRTLHEFGLPESALPKMLGGLMERGGNPVVGTSAQTGYVTCKLRYEGDAQRAEEALAKAEERVRALLDPFVFGAEDETLAFAVSALLRARGERVTTAESCTGGLLAKWLTDGPGSSDIFVGGWTAYTNEFKQRELAVRAEVLATHGAVSRETAVAMARGALHASAEAGAPATHALAITGVAGPGGGSAEKPVGTVWIGRATRDGDEDVRRFLFPDQRDAVRERSALAALMMLRLKLIGRTDVKLLWEQ